MIPGRGLPLQFDRSYSSAGSTSDGPLGAGWTHNYNVRLVQDDCGHLTVIGGEGSGNTFQGASPTPRAPPNFDVPAALVSQALFFTPQVGFHSTLVQPIQRRGV